MASPSCSSRTSSWPSPNSRAPRKSSKLQPPLRRARLQPLEPRPRVPPPQKALPPQRRRRMLGRRRENNTSCHGEMLPFEARSIDLAPPAFPRGGGGGGGGEKKKPVGGGGPPGAGGGGPSNHTYFFLFVFFPFS